MLVGQDYKVTSDTLNIVLWKRNWGSKKQWNLVGYFSSLRHALAALVDLGVMATELVDLASITERQNELYALIEEVKDRKVEATKDTRKEG